MRVGQQWNSESGVVQGCQQSISYLMSTKFHKGLQFALLYDQQAIQQTVSKLAQQINEYYNQIKQQQGTLELVVVCILKGAFMFYSDLVKLLKHTHTNHFIKVRSYSGLLSTGEITLEPQLLPQDFVGRHVLIVEDMFDTGTTLKKLIARFQELKPKKVDTVVLIKRPDRPLTVELKFWGLECGDFIVGYGMDYDEFGRSFTAIYQKI